MAKNVKLRSSVRQKLLRMPLFNTTAAWLSRSAPAIFMYHRVLPAGEPFYSHGMVTGRDLFIAMAEWLKSRFDVVPLAELPQYAGRRARRPKCALTFDDGWLDTYNHAYPVLRDLSLPATVFLPVNYIGTTRRFWQDRLWNLITDAAQRGITAIPDDLPAPWWPLATRALEFEPIRKHILLHWPQEVDEFLDRVRSAIGLPPEAQQRVFIDWEQVREMERGGFTFGSHTTNHVTLTRVALPAAEQEIRGSRAALGALLGHTVDTFCYPFGANTPELRKAVAAAGYKVGVTTRAQLLHKSEDVFALPRIGVSSSSIVNGRGDFSPQSVQFYMAKASMGLSPQIHHDR